MSLFVGAIPYNFYALLTIVMMFFIAITRFDFGLMKKHEKNAIENGDLFSTDIKEKYNDYIDDVGVTYYANFESFFPKANDLVIVNQLYI